MFTDEQKTELNKPLDRRSVTTRQQAGQTLSYVEGWWVIAEANRIFGFDGWTSETVELRQLGEPYQVSGKETWRVNYAAKVRLTVGDVVREGCGFGQGIDRDVGQAHESAIKEAETDSRKRALMTFGNPFGLALYDKSQSNVATIKPERPDPAEPLNDKTRDWLATQLDAAQIAPGDCCRVFEVSSLKQITYGQIPEIREWIAEKKKAA